MKKSHRLAYGGAAIALAAAALSIHLVAASGNAARSGRVRVVAGSFAPPLLEIRGDSLAGRGKTAQLASRAAGGLVGTAFPLAAVSPDGATLAYNSFRWNRHVDRIKSFAEQGISTGDALAVPTLRLRDLSTGNERDLGPGTMSVAWRADGALAYVRGVPPAYRANLPFLANVIVRSPTGNDDAWSSEPGEYEVAAWAGRTLLVQKSVPGAAPDVVAFDGPHAPRTLAQSVLFLGVSPDGTAALVAQTLADDAHPRIRLLRVADGAEIASLPIADAHDPVTGDPLASVYGPADWRGDRVVMPTETGLLVLHVDDGLRVEQVVHVDAATKPDASLFEPRFGGDDDTIVAWGGLPGTAPDVQAVQYVCNRVALTCTRGAPAAPADAPRPVYDLSGGTR